MTLAVKVALNPNTTNQHVFPLFQIVDKGVIPVAIKMLATEDTSCHSSACRLLWTLSFDKNVREKIKENSELMELLDGLKTSPDSQVKKNASGALWVIGGENDITAETRGYILSGVILCSRGFDIPAKSILA